MIIRHAIKEDIPALATMLLEMSTDTNLNLPATSTNKIHLTLSALLSEGAVLTAWTDSGKLMGAVALQEFSPWYSEEVCLGDVFTYVVKEFRSTRAAISLLKEAQKYAKMRNLVLMLAVLSGNNAESKDKLYKSQGFQYLGGLFGFNLSMNSKG